MITYYAKGGCEVVGGVMYGSPLREGEGERVVRNRPCDAMGEFFRTTMTKATGATEGERSEVCKVLPLAHGRSWSASDKLRDNGKGYVNMTSRHGKRRKSAERVHSLIAHR